MEALREAPPRRSSGQEIREELERLGQREPLIVAHWTDLAASVQYKESLDIESNPEKLQKWLSRQEALTDRALRFDELRMTLNDVSEAAPSEEA